MSTSWSTSITALNIPETCYKRPATTCSIKGLYQHEYFHEIR